MCDTKICSKCGKELSLDDFHKRKSSKDGYRGVCKVCVKLYIKNRVAKLNLVPTIGIEKVCIHCNILQPLNNFYKNSNTKDLHDSTCKTCIKHNIKNKVDNFDLNSIIITHKICSGCNIDKSINEFNIDKGHSDGHVSRCKTCTKESAFILRSVNININENKLNKISTKICSRCHIEKSSEEFNICNTSIYGLSAYCKQCSKIYSIEHRKQHTSIDRKYQAKRRNFGYKSINKTFNWSESHHLHLEENHDFVINIPTWLHKLYSHSSVTWRNMNSINALALDFWINEELYKDLYEL